MYSAWVLRWLRLVPLAAALGVAAIPLWQYGRRVQAETAAEAFLGQLTQAQLAFRQRNGSRFATTLESLTTGCPGDGGRALDAGAVQAIVARGFLVTVRAAARTEAGAPDCHGRPTAADYYAALQPASADAAPRRAYGMTGQDGRVFVFFDGLAPIERDMTPGGLATPLDQVGRFRIP